MHRLRPGELPKPTPTGSQILIRVRAAAVTISDCIVRSGKVNPLLWLPMRMFVGFTRPRNPVLGLDLAGEVEAVDSAVRRFKVGDPVIAFTGKHFGAYAKYACLPADGVGVFLFNLTSLKLYISAIILLFCTIIDMMAIELSGLLQ